MIRQSISCDVCGAEKKQTNHWFVAYTRSGELRVSGWSAEAKLRAGSKHLCGQTCLHKLVDEFIASVSVRMQPAVPDVVIEEPVLATDASLTSIATHANATSAQRTLPAPTLPARIHPVIPATLIAIAPSRAVDEPCPPLAASVADSPNYASRHWRTEAWERERERERRSNLAARRKSS